MKLDREKTETMFRVVQIEKGAIIYLVYGVISWHNIGKDFLPERSIMK